jgi:sarcosine oxidase
MAAYDVAIIGLGIIGSAALLRATQRGLRAIGIEALEPGHDCGSSHGETRVFRLAYFEHPSYVPLLREAHTLWRAIEAAAGRSLLTTTGVVEIGPASGELVSGTLASARLHGLRHELLDADRLTRRFPAFLVPPSYVGVFQPDGGYLAAEAAVDAQIALARAGGARVQSAARVTAIEAGPNGVVIQTQAGADIEARTAVVAAGPWTTSLLPELSPFLRVTRQVLGWLSPPSPGAFSPECFPVFLFESPLGIHYGFPVHSSQGLKLARHHHLDETTNADAVDRVVSSRDKEAILAFRDRFLPAAAGPLTHTTTCLYTMTPDGHFIIDRLPDRPQVIVASACSGHGFKFAPVIGDILTDLAVSGTTARDISRFGLSRFHRA